MSEVKVPNHVAIIMDGNGRWAQNRGLKRTKGHQKGAEALKEISNCIYDKGVKVLSVFAFSTENWKRDKEEVDYIMDLFIKSFKESFKSVKEKNVRVVFSGLRERLNDNVLKAMDDMMEETKNNTSGIFNICLNYGGQGEIVNATKKICKDVQDGVIEIEDINNDSYNNYLFNNLPPIDLLIRTSGEYRISNFMLWQMAYAELYFTNTLWPDFDEEELNKALESYLNRDRRFGSIKK